LSLWALDSAHALWVKMPNSRMIGASVAGPISQFSVFSVMGAPSTNTSDVFVFPNPWRPHGPNAGTAAGQTGTDAGGITFSSIPSECTIKIYTLSGELVRNIHHSDLTGPVGQEVWDGKTSGGDRAASGVYLWRVESATDGKNGKLMIIR
jgi:flagellar hook capping protein FlgD